jgi:hypothetical protein
MTSNGNLMLQMLYQFFVVTVLVFSGVGVAAGIGLIVASAPTLRFFHSVNRWISTRGVLRPMEIPRDTDRFSHRRRRWVGGALIAGGVFSVFGLAAGVDPAAVGAAFAKGDASRLVAIASGTLRWFLILGSAAGVAVGLVLCYSPDGLARIEKYANQWFSGRQVLRGSDDMNLTLDRLVEAHPAPSGWILACTALGAAGYAATLLFART